MPRKLFVVLILLLGVPIFIYHFYLSFQYDHRLPTHSDSVSGRVYPLYPNHSLRFATQSELRYYQIVALAGSVGCILAMVGGVMLMKAGSSPTISLRHSPVTRADLHDIPESLSPIRLGASLVALLDAVRLHWKSVVPFWLVPTYFVLMANLGPRLFGQTLTMGILVPVPMFWTFLRVGRLYTNKAISLGQVVVFVVFMPFLVLISLAPLIRAVLAQAQN